MDVCVVSSLLLRLMLRPVSVPGCAPRSAGAGELSARSQKWGAGHQALIHLDKVMSSCFPEWQEPSWSLSSGIWVPVASPALSVFGGFMGFLALADLIDIVFFSGY